MGIDEENHFPDRGAALELADGIQRVKEGVFGAHVGRLQPQLQQFSGQRGQLAGPVEHVDEVETHDGFVVAHQ